MHAIKDSLIYSDLQFFQQEVGDPSTWHGNAGD